MSWVLRLEHGLVLEEGHARTILTMVLISPDTGTGTAACWSTGGPLGTCYDRRVTSYLIDKKRGYGGEIEIK